MSKDHSVRLHRVLRASPEKIFRAFTEADALAAWIPPNGFTAKVQQMDVRVGGTFRMSFTNFTSGNTMGFGGEYLEVIPNQRLRYTDVFDDPNLSGTILVTIDFKPVSVGTELSITQEGIPEVIPLEHCYLGWQESLEKLVRLVEPEVMG